MEQKKTVAAGFEAALILAIPAESDAHAHACAIGSGLRTERRT